MNGQPAIKVVFNGLGPDNVYHSSKGDCKDGTVIDLPLDEAISVINGVYAIEGTPSNIKRVKTILEADNKKREEIARKVAEQGGRK
jgi:predicted membrane GTPase involved in stress response